MQGCGRLPLAMADHYYIGDRWYTPLGDAAAAMPVPVAAAAQTGANLVAGAIGVWLGSGSGAQPPVGLTGRLGVKMCNLMRPFGGIPMLMNLCLFVSIYWIDD